MCSDRLYNPSNTFWPFPNQDTFYRYPPPTWSLQNSANFSSGQPLPSSRGPPFISPLVSPRLPRVPWPSPASNISTPFSPTLSRDHHHRSHDQSCDQPIHEHQIKEMETTPKNTSEKPSTSSSSSSKKRNPRVRKRWSHRPRLHPPSRPQVTINRTKRDPNGDKYPHISLLCYNVLSQDLISENMYLYNFERFDWLDWEYRKTRLFKELIYSEADIMCLQEVTEEHYYNWYQRKLQSYGYGGVYVKRTGNCKDGCAIFYHSGTVGLLEVNHVEYQKHKGILDRDNVGIIVKFQHRKHQNTPSKREFLVANTHLLFNPRAGEVKLAQLSYLLAELHKMSATSSSGYLPCILCGDLNSLPNSPLVQFLLEGQLDYTHLSATVIAGYNRIHSTNKYRHIPFPLLPDDMKIGTNCQYNDFDANFKTKTTPTNKIHSAHYSDNKTTPTNELDSTQRSDNQTTPTNELNSDNKTTPTNELDSTHKSDNQTTPTMESDLQPKSKKIRVATPDPDRPPAILTHPFTFTSCYPMPRPDTISPTVTTFHQSAAETVDYILCTPPGEEKGAGFHVVRRDALPSFSTLEKLGPQPNEVLSSDHLYLYAELQLVTA